MKRNIFRTLLFLTSVGIIIFSVQKLYEIYAEYEKGKSAYVEIAEQYVTRLVTDDTLPSSIEKIVLPEPVEPLKTAPISVSFKDLLAECDDVVGWLYCAETLINYPVVQGRDNNYYLRRLPDGSYNINGTIFMDYRNSPDFSDWNTVIYGHNMNNDTMFGILQRYNSQDYFDTHPVWYLLTPEQDYRIELLGGYTTSSTDADTYSIPDNVQGRDELIEKVMQYTTFQSEVEIGDEDLLITLSTCADDYDARYVLVGVLRELTRLTDWY